MASGVILKQSFFQKMRKLRREIDKKGEATVSDLATLGKYYAKARVPFYSGDTYRAIKKRTLKKSTGPEARIFISPKQPQDGRKRNIANFDLVYYMHTRGKSSGHFKSGDPEFLFRTQEYLNKIKTRTAKGIFGNIKIK